MVGRYSARKKNPRAKLYAKFELSKRYSTDSDAVAFKNMFMRLRELVYWLSDDQLSVKAIAAKGKCYIFYAYVLE